MDPFEKGKTIKNPWQTLSVREVYDNPWIQVSHHETLNPKGGPGIYGVIHFKNLAIGVIPVDHEGNTYLVGQWRYTLNAYSWEIPEGGGPLGIDPLESARRELMEETGLTAKKWTLLSPIHTSNSVTNEKGYLFLAEELEQGESEPEDTEDISVWKVPLSKAVEMVEAGEITDSLSMAGLLLAARKFGV